MTNIQFDLDCTGREFVRKFICVISLMGIVLFSGCSTSTQFGSIASDIELASRSTSPFDETIFSGEIIQHNTNTENLPEYRIFHKKNPPKKTISDAYENLLQLKNLLDAGVITQEEFNNEKGKVFSAP